MSTQKLPDVCLVTGASTGIGAATAVALGRSGAAVAVHYHRSATAAESVVAAILNEGGTARSFAADLARPEAADALIGAVIEEFGRIDVLVNNAGSLVGRRLLAEIDDGYWNEVLELNLSSVMRLTRAAVPHMRGRGGAIINVASVAARSGGSAGVLAYAAAKAGVVGMTKALAKELIRDNIRVNAVNPGVIATPLHDRFTTPERMRDLVAAIPQNRAGMPEEVASVIAFLASPGASYVVGETIEINGGLWTD